MTYPLHECVFRNDIRQLSSLLRTSDISQKDKYGKQSKKIFIAKKYFFLFLNQFSLVDNLVPEICKTL